MTLFDSCNSKLFHEVTWQQVYELIRGEALRPKTEALRAMVAQMEGLPEVERKVREKEVKRMKASWFPGLLPACHCRDGVRRLDHVTDYTGYCHVDFDHLTEEQVADVRARLREVPEVLLMQTSMRGHGLHVYYRLAPAPQGEGNGYQNTYIQGFRQGNAYIAELAGVPYDPALEPPVHLSCPCYDADVYYNPEAVPFHIDMEHPVDQKQKKAKVQKKRSKRRRGDDGITKAEHIVEFLQQQPLRYDTLSRKIQVQAAADAEGGGEGPLWQELTERRTNDLYVECCKAVGLNLSFQDFKHVLNSGVVPEVNPLREYIFGLPEWDGVTDHIAAVAGMVKALTPDGEDLLWYTCFKKWFCAMVASWMRDDVVNHQVLVLIGEQGIFKTTWLDALLPPELAQYRCRQSGARAIDKDEQLRATEFGLINMDEIDRMSEQELNALKSLITASDINVRAAYAQSKERRLRVASYVASGNKDRFLTDTTGNRRWLPFHVASIESPFDHPLPYAGMYAQAWALVRQGFNYWFSLRDIHSVASHVEDFMVETSEEQLLPVYFSPCQPGTAGAQFLTVAEISAKLTLYGTIRRPMDIRQLGALLRKMGYIQRREGRGLRRGYLVQEKSAESINAERKLMAQISGDKDSSDTTAAPMAPIEPIFL